MCSGILAEDTSGSFAEHGRMYLAASYVKFVESAGARVVPILCVEDRDLEQLIVTETLLLL